MSSIIQQIPIRDARILAFRQTKSYPKPGSIIAVNSNLIEQYAKELEQSRDSEDKAFSKICPKLPNANNKSSFFYSTHIERKYQLSSDVLLIVDSVIPGKKECKIKCHLSLLVWPYDIDIEKQFIYFDDTDVNVVEPVVCLSEWHFSDKQPDQIDTFGVQVKINDQYLWHLYRKESVMSAPFVQTAINMGMKEFSYINNPNANLIAQPTQQIPVVASTQTINTTSLSDEDEDDEFELHPLAEFVEKLYEITCRSMDAHAINTSEEFRESLRDKFIQLTINSDIRIDFYDDEDDAE